MGVVPLSHSSLSQDFECLDLLILCEHFACKHECVPRAYSVPAEPPCGFRAVSLGPLGKEQVLSAWSRLSSRLL